MSPSHPDTEMTTKDPSTEIQNHTEELKSFPSTYNDDQATLCTVNDHLTKIKDAVEKLLRESEASYAKHEDSDGKNQDDKKGDVKRSVVLSSLLRIDTTHLPGFLFETQILSSDDGETAVSIPIMVTKLLERISLMSDKATRDELKLSVDIMELAILKVNEAISRIGNEEKAETSVGHLTKDSGDEVIQPPTPPTD